MKQSARRIGVDRHRLSQPFETDALQLGMLILEAESRQIALRPSDKRW